MRNGETQQRKLIRHALGVLAATAIGLALLGGGGGSARADTCPEYPGQTHEQIVAKVEGRLKGDWAMAIQTTKRAIQRLTQKGRDASKAELFVQVLTCLQKEVKNGAYAAVVAEARKDPRAALAETTPKTPSTQGQSSGSQSSTQATQSGGETPPPAVLIPPAGGQTSQPAAPQPAPPSTPLASEQTQTAEAPAQAPTPTAPPINAPPPVATFNQGAALPGTAESYQSTAPASQPQQAAVAPTGDYTGGVCNYFTRPYQEMIDGVLHLNRYSDGEWVCNAGTMYACAVGVWQNMGACTQYSLWETRLSTTLEAKPR